MFTTSTKRVNRSRMLSLESTALRTFTHAELSEFNGTDPSKPIYLALKGQVYDVSSKPQLYGPEGQMHQFAGKDCSRVYGLSARAEDFLVDYSSLNEQEMEALENWVSFYDLAYKVVGTLRKA
ncbi:cytochrome b5 [Rhizoclosmatium globosum]|uniref:Cytochrome b5 n=1 Tax=Rhizoclosmatium globosum TaxID=329046 RepID=A0A1Y2CNM9_9FUNG|nr:cytochrome b5 [Rhizoclosmatium globosum]|eukprot:ORY48454.1 cytochrome b5 [Rhizoclosmatium globosum]